MEQNGRKRYDGSHSNFEPHEKLEWRKETIKVTWRPAKGKTHLDKVILKYFN